MVQAASGGFYGAAGGCGAFADGTVFEVTPAGTLTTLHSFADTDGGDPMLPVQANNGNVYGVTYYGGPYLYGTFFGISPGGKFITLHNFRPVEGGGVNGLTEAANGNFYGTTFMAAATITALLISVFRAAELSSRSRRQAR